jgi:hypothetical protein
MPVIVDDEELYFFTYLNNNVYVPAYIGWLDRNTIKAFELVGKIQKDLRLTTQIAEIKFVVKTAVPLYLIPYDNDEVYEFASDDNTIDLFPSGLVAEDSTFDREISFPSFFYPGVKLHIEFKLFNELHMQQDGKWFRINI